MATSFRVTKKGGKGHAGDIALTMVQGVTVVENGRHTSVDEGEIMRTAALAARKIWDLAADRGIFPRM